MWVCSDLNTGVVRSFLAAPLPSHTGVPDRDAEWREPMNPMTVDFWFPVGTAVLCGLIVGLERQVNRKPAGIRTSMLVCLGTTLFIRLGAELGGGQTDPTRVLGQIITGVGFIGGGAILARGDKLVGVTTAAVVWVLAAIGALIGAGHLTAAVVIAVLCVVLLSGVEWIETRFRKTPEGDDQTADSEQPPT